MHNVTWAVLKKKSKPAVENYIQGDTNHTKMDTLQAFLYWYNLLIKGIKVKTDLNAIDTVSVLSLLFFTFIAPSYLESLTFVKSC